MLDRKFLGQGGTIFLQQRFFRHIVKVRTNSNTHINVFFKNYFLQNQTKMMDVKNMMKNSTNVELAKKLLLNMMI